MKKLKWLLLSLTMGLGAAEQASATVWQYTAPPFSGGLSANAGQIDSITTTYDDVTQQLTWSSTISDNGNLANGFRLSMSNGANANGIADTYAMFYGDGATNRLTAYNYSGNAGASTWNDPSRYIDTFGLSSVTAGGSTTFSFSLNASAINSFLGGGWQGAQFGPNIGIWYHPVVLTNTAYNGNLLTDYSFSAIGWNDFSGQPTTNITPPGGVPEPDSLALLLGAGLMGFGVLRQQKRHLAGNSDDWGLTA